MTKSKVANISQGCMHCIVPDKPGRLLCMDLMGPLPPSRGGVRLKRATTQSILNKVFKNYFCHVKMPEAILSDNDTQITSKLRKSKLLTVGVKCEFTSIYSPQGNPTERCNKEISRYE